MSHRSVALLCAALALIALVLWLAASSSDDGGAAVRAGDSAAAGSGEVRAVRASDDERRSEADVQRDETRHAAVRDASIAHEPAAGEQFEVRVLLMPSRKPVGSARVRFWSPPKLTGWQRWGRWDEALESGQLEQLLSEDTLEVLTDDSGRATLPTASGGVVVADSEAVFGVAWCEPDRSAPLMVEVHPDFAVAARVVDASGSTKAGIRVALRVDYDWGDVSDVASAISDREGVALIEHAGWRLSEWEISGDHRVTLALAGPLDPSIEREIDALAPPIEPVELRLGAFGELEVAVFDAEGRPLASNDDVELHRIERPSATDEEYEYVYPGASSPLRDGVALFPCVALEQEFAAVLNFDEGGRHVATKTGRGPVHIGDRARIELRFEPVRGVQARLVDVAGAPLVEREVEVFTEREPGASADRLCISRTDGEGRLRIAETGGDSVLLVFVVEDERGLERSAAKATAQGRITGASLDLGDLVVTPMPTIAAGRVVDASGLALSGARVEARTGAVDEREPPRTNWSNFRWNDTRTDDEGRFELRSEFRSARLALEAHWGEARSAPLEIEIATHDLELVVESMGSIRGTLRLDRSLSATSLQVFAELKGPRAARQPDFQRWRASAADSQGAFSLIDLDPGVYDVFVQQREDHFGELARVENVVVRAGEPCADSRLNPLEIAHHGLSLRVLDESGAPVSGGVCWAHFHDSPPGEWMNIEVLNGRVTVAARVLPVELALSCDGYLSQALGPVAASREVVLQRAPRVRMELDPVQSVTVEGVSLGVQLSPAGEADGAFRFTWLEFGASASTWGHPPFLGEADVEVYLEGLDSQSQWRWQPIESAEPRTITIGPARAGDQSFRIRIEPAALKSALDTFKR